MKTTFSLILTALAFPALAQVEIDQRIILSGTDGNRMIEQLEAPVNSTDAVNKEYVDSAVSASGGAPQPTMVSNETPSGMNFAAGLRYCRDLVEDGHSDWRMPSLTEIFAAYTSGANPISSDTSANWLWIAERPSGCTNCSAHFVMFRFSDGYITSNTPDNSYRIRCVR